MNMGFFGMAGKTPKPGLVLVESHIANNSPTLEFRKISNAYDDYLLELVDLIMATNNVTLEMQYSSDGGSTWEASSNYYSSGFYIQNGGTTGNFNSNPTTFFNLGSGIINTSSRPYQASFYLRSLGSIALSKVVYGNFAFTNQSFVVGGVFQALLLVPGTAYNAFKIFPSSGNIASGVARLYGVAKT